MAKKSIFLILFITVLVFRISHSQERPLNFPVLKGPYVGQKPPGDKPELFAPEMISAVSKRAFGAVFARGGEIFLFNPYFEGKSLSVFLTEMKNGKWTEPSPAPFNSDYNDWDMNIAPDGITLYFTSKRPVNGTGEPSQYANIWVTLITSSGWTQPEMLEYPVNTKDSDDQYASVTKNGTLYFFSNRTGGFGKFDIYRVELVDGKYGHAENLGKVINTEYSDYDLYVAPDESYLIFASQRPGGFTESDLYVTFRKNDDTWTEPVNLGRDINSIAFNSPSVTPDGKYLFFYGGIGERTIYWVNADFLTGLKPKNIK